MSEIKDPYQWFHRGCAALSASIILTRIMIAERTITVDWIQEIYNHTNWIQYIKDIIWDGNTFEAYDLLFIIEFNFRHAVEVYLKSIILVKDPWGFKKIHDLEELYITASIRNDQLNLIIQQLSDTYIFPSTEIQKDPNNIGKKYPNIERIIDSLDKKCEAINSTSTLKDKILFEFDEMDSKLENLLKDMGFVQNFFTDEFRKITDEKALITEEVTTNKNWF